MDKVKYFGHRYSVPTVFVTETLSWTDTLHVEHLLHSCGITMYDVLNVSDYNPLNEVCQVGSKVEKQIENKIRSATLGGFALRKIPGIREQLCGLIAAHVATHFFWDLSASDHSTFLLCGQEVRIDKDSLLRCTGTTDIAAFVIDDNMKSQIPINGQYKTLNNTIKPCKMHTWSDKKFQDPFPVYIRGASTELGLGLVTSCDLVGKGMEHLVFIENEMEEDFCQPGDSGSIVCYDSDVEDHILAVALVLGESNKQNKFVALKLDFGIHELSSRQNGNFTFVDNM